MNLKDVLMSINVEMANDSHRGRARRGNRLDRQISNTTLKEDRRDIRGWYQNHNFTPEEWDEEEYEAISSMEFPNREYGRYEGDFINSPDFPDVERFNMTGNGVKRGMETPLDTKQDSENYVPIDDMIARSPQAKKHNRERGTSEMPMPPTTGVPPELMQMLEQFGIDPRQLQGAMRGRDISHQDVQGELQGTLDSGYDGVPMDKAIDPMQLIERIIEGKVAAMMGSSGFTGERGPASTKSKTKFQGKRGDKGSLPKRQAGEQRVNRNPRNAPPLKGDRE